MESEQPMPVRSRCASPASSFELIDHAGEHEATTEVHGEEGAGNLTTSWPGYDCSPPSSRPSSSLEDTGLEPDEVLALSRSSTPEWLQTPPSPVDETTAVQDQDAVAAAVTAAVADLRTRESAIDAGAPIVGTEEADTETPSEASAGEPFRLTMWRLFPSELRGTVGIRIAFATFMLVLWVAILGGLLTPAASSRAKASTVCMKFGSPKEPVGVPDRQNICTPQMCHGFGFHRTCPSNTNSTSTAEAEIKEMRADVKEIRQLFADEVQQGEARRREAWSSGFAAGAAEAAGEQAAPPEPLAAHYRRVSEEWQQRAEALQAQLEEALRGKAEAEAALAEAAAAGAAPPPGWRTVAGQSLRCSGTEYRGTAPMADGPGIGGCLAAAEAMEQQGVNYAVYPGATSRDLAAPPALLAPSPRPHDRARQATPTATCAPSTAGRRRSRRASRPRRTRRASWARTWSSRRACPRSSLPTASPSSRASSTTAARRPRRSASPASRRPRPPP